MNSLDDLPDQLQALFDRARAGLDREIGKARTALDSLNAEKAVAANALAELNDQCKSVKADLDRSREYLGRASTLAQLDREIAKGRTELERLTVENAEQSKALEAVTKKRASEEAQVLALQNDARLATAERCRAQEIKAQIIKQLEAAAA